MPVPDYHRPIDDDRDDRYDDRHRKKKGANKTILIVVAIVALVFLVGMLVVGGMVVMAYARVRESAARLQTTMNLKHCALAIHAYHDNFAMLPSGFGTGGQQRKNTSIWVHLLPYVEQQPLYNLLSNQCGPNDVAFKAVIPPYLAAGDAYLKTPDGVVNFAANVRIFGHKTLKENQQPVNEPGSAVAVPEGPMIASLQLRRIEDGTMNVIMLSTRYSECGGQRTWFAVDAHGKSNHGVPPSPGKGGFMGAGSSTTPPSRAGEITDTYQLTPNDRECRPDAGLFGHSFSAIGMTVAQCDTAVRNVAPTMSPLTFARALCPGDKQKLDDDWRDDQ